MRKLPSLNAVRAFEAVVRHGSLTKAAEELHVTHGALSRQVALIEDWVGRPLFIRTPSSQLIPTEAGRRYGRELTGLLDRLATLSAAAREDVGSVISIMAAPTFAMNWLIPRMTGFQRRHTEVSVKLATSTKPAHLQDGDSDIVIHSVRAKQDRVTCVSFMDDYYVPICHVDLLEDRPAGDEDWLKRQVLISYASWPDSWEVWLPQSGVAGALGARRQQFEQMFFGRQAALEGMGVAILPLAVVLDDMVQGRLTAPFGLRHSRHRPWLACFLASRATDPLITAFIDWLREAGHDFELSAGACVDELGWADNPFATKRMQTASDP
ncbi:LysR substrate-binding domain-containing protein [Variovorax sp. OV084]|jgi:LysR family glycine cleavage system transcriptional activator|uniref:LysR substrate-binding domain-containing protein n=1 Tax=Variovorax TaxID=34072 RepID=UPI0008B9051A|nr:LysR substrate-binding domain-containing protein [Variovorax sp. OV084]SEU24031.1 LysR family transcriptional regulator, glycine cleavage system transcriptional activator [Variovorax sp. OV084]